MCDYCKKPGHTKERCFKLHGYPCGSKGLKQKKFASQVEVEVTKDIATTTHIPELTEAQYAKLLWFLNQSGGESSTQLSSYAILQVKLLILFKIPSL